MRAKRVDENQKTIVETFRKLGCSVYVTSHVGHGFPDLVVGVNKKNYLIEIKDGKKCPSAQKMTEFEEKFINEWRGAVNIVRSIDDVIDLVNNC